MSNYIMMPKTDWEDILDAAREKTGSTKLIKSGELANVIAAGGSGGIDTSDATATKNDILANKTAYVKEGKVTGNIPTKTASDLTVSGATVNVPTGYYASDVSKSVSTVTQVTPIISVSSAGKITATATQSEGYVVSGTKTATKQLTTKAATTFTPSTTDQTIASGTYLTGKQTIKGDSNLIAENIKSGVSIFGVSGTYEGSGSGGGDSSGDYTNDDMRLFFMGYCNEFTLPDGIQEIRQYAFYNFPYLKTVYGMENIMIIFHSAFIGCVSLEDLTFSNALQVIGQQAFKGCVSLQSVEIPPNCRIMDSEAFADCTNLKYVTIVNPYYQYATDIFKNCNITEFRLGCGEEYAADCGYPWGAASVGNVIYNYTG